MQHFGRSCVGLNEIPDGDWFCNACSFARQQRLRRVAASEVREQAVGVWHREPCTFDNSGVHQRVRPRHRSLVVDSDEEEEEDVARLTHGAYRERHCRSHRETGGAHSTFRRPQGANVLVEIDCDDSNASGSRSGPLELNACQQGSKEDNSNVSDESDLLLENVREITDKHNDSSSRLAGAQRSNQTERTRNRGSRDQSIWVGPNNERDHSHGQLRASCTGSTRQARERIDAFTRNWESLRSGDITFDDISPAANSGSDVCEGSGRRRLVSARQLSTRATNPASKTSKPSHTSNSVESTDFNCSMDYVDLTKSESPAMRHLMHARKDGTRGPILSPPLISLGARLRAEVSSSRRKGAQIPARNISASSVPRSSTEASRGKRRTSIDRGSPLLIDSDGSNCDSFTDKRPAENWKCGSSTGKRLRTVADMAFGAHVATSPSLQQSPRSRQRREESRSVMGHSRWRHGGSPSNRYHDRSSPNNVFAKFSCEKMTAENAHGSYANGDGRSSPKPLVERLQCRFNASHPAKSSYHMTSNDRTIRYGGDSKHVHTLGSTDASMLHHGRFSLNASENPTGSRDDACGHGLNPRGTPHGLKTVSDGESMGSNLKKKAYSLVKEELRMLFDNECITREQYANAAKEATHLLYQKFKSSPQDMTRIAASLAVDEAMKSILD